MIILKVHFGDGIALKPEGNPPVAWQGGQARPLGCHLRKGVWGPCAGTSRRSRWIVRHYRTSVKWFSEPQSGHMEDLYLLRVG